MGSFRDLTQRPLEVTLADRPFRVGELRLCDLEELEEWIESRWADPLEAVRPFLDAECVALADRHLFAEAAVAAEERPPHWGDRRADEMFATVPGVFAFLSTVLKRYHPVLTADEVVGLIAELRPGEYPNLRRVVSRALPADVLARAVERLTGTRPDPTSGEPPRWREWADEVARSHQGWTYEYIMSLTVAQFFNALNQGRSPEPGGRRLGPGEDVGAIRRRRRAWFAGEDVGRSTGGGE